MLKFADIEATARNRTLDCLLWLMPDGKLCGEEFCALNPTRADHAAGSFSYNTRKHVWSDFACADKGRGIISLWGYVRNQPFVIAAREVAAWLGIIDDKMPDRLERHETENQTAKAAKVAKPAKQQECIASLWRQSRPAHGTLVETYLYSRGITCPIPPTIRYLSSHKHCETGLFLPVMLSAIAIWPSRNIIALHRTFLKADGLGKADVTSNKKMLGSVTGGAVRLDSSAEIMTVGEGIETCLAVQQASRIPTWAGLSTSGLMNLVLPALPLGREIIIAADNDEAGINAAHKAAK
ncbi:MAG: toprim domain-containing protein, partial [Alphaproteobacteria bacterium]|nr:toprim domain-containing protein [Alphaproteobacteria bacterium]